MRRTIPPSTAAVLTARIVEWDRQKGYGFLEVGKQRVFLHIRDFAEWHKRPAVGARGMEWRLPEAGLHLLELLGGWPGAFLAQRRLRHKTSKVRYQILFWLIVLLYQLVAFDSLQNWNLSRAALNRLQTTYEHRR